MALYINKEKNSLIFDQKDFKINNDYIPVIILALQELDPKRVIHFAIELEETPMIFVLYIRKLLKEASVDLRIYHTDESQALKTALKGYGIPYYNIKEFPDANK